MGIRMAFILSGLLTVAGVSTAGPRADGTELKIEKAQREILVRAMAYGSMQQIDNALLIIRLYSFDVPGSCVPETNAVCARRYVLILSSYDEAPVVKAYDLGEVGEITKIDFSGQELEKTWKLEMKIQNFPTSVLKSNPRLSRRIRKAKLKISADDLSLGN